MKSKIPVGIVDDHQLFLTSLKLLIESSLKYSVVLEASNGKELQEKIKDVKQLPAIMLIDVRMPKMDGEETAKWIKNNYPQIKMLALSGEDRTMDIVNMIKVGCCGFLLKDMNPKDFEEALMEVCTAGQCSKGATADGGRIDISPIEKMVLELCSTDMTYQRIVDKIGKSERTVDGYREVLFKKLNAKTRTGMVIAAIRMGIIKI
jgi:DNA-binding NarL/FixJ family response regulator